MIISSLRIRNEQKILYSPSLFNKSSLHPVVNHPTASNLGVRPLLSSREYSHAHFLFWQTLEWIACTWKTFKLSESKFSPA